MGLSRPETEAPRSLLGAGSEPGVPRIKRRHRRRIGETPVGLLLLLPAAILLVLVMWSPIGYAVMTSFQQVELTISPDKPWVGLANYRQFLTDSLFWQSVVRTIIFGAVTVAVGTTVALGVALTLNERFPGRNLARVILLLPWAVASLVTGIMWQYLFNGKFGVVNAILYKLGLIHSYIDWLADPHRALVIAAVATAWKYVPFLALMLLASLQSIPESLYRAAKMDGANVWQRFRVITFPHLRAIFGVILVYQIVAALLTFDLIYGFTQGGPGYATTVVNYLVYIEAFQRLSLGVASAMSLALALLIMLLSGASLLLLISSARRQRNG